MTDFIALGVVCVVLAIGNLLTAYANYRTHCNLVRALEAQQNFNDCVVEFQRRVSAWAGTEIERIKRGQAR